jgi:glycosyltransferase involved in cell wall biosynthesis
MKAPLVSVCIPCHNAAPFVGAALDSVLSQSWTALEVIVVDDGSDDASPAILDGYRKRGVQVITARCGSAAKARNQALEAATGDYIKFFDADDLLSPDHIARQIGRLGNRTDAVASSEWGRFQGDDFSSFHSNPQSVWRDMIATDWLVEAWADARPMMQPGMFLIPHKILETSGGWDEHLTLIDDFEFFARVLCHSEEVLFTPGATLYYRSGISGSLSGQKSRKGAESAFHSLIQGTSHLLERRNDDPARQSSANILQDFIYTFYPDHPDLCRQIGQKIKDLGGSNLLPDGPPAFHRIRPLIGWKLARRVQRLAGS